MPPSGGSINRRSVGRGSGLRRPGGSQGPAEAAEGQGGEDPEQDVINGQRSEAPRGQLVAEVAEQDGDHGPGGVEQRTQDDHEVERGAEDGQEVELRGVRHAGHQAAEQGGVAMAGAEQLLAPRVEALENAGGEQADQGPTQQVVEHAGDSDNSHAAKEIETHAGDEVEPGDGKSRQREDGDGGDDDGGRQGARASVEVGRIEAPPQGGRRCQQAERQECVEGAATGDAERADSEEDWGGRQRRGPVRLVGWGVGHAAWSGGSQQ